MIVRRIVQVISVLFLGAAGLALLLSSALSGYGVILNQEYITLLLILFTVVLGAFMIWAAYQVLCHYSSKSIKSLSAIVAIVVMGGLGNMVDPIADQLLETKHGDLAPLVGGVLPLFAAYFTYWTLSKVLMKYTLEEGATD